MENLILGLLMFKGRSVYEIKARIEQGINLMYSASLGSIQAAVKKLLREGCIEFAECIENGKYKKIYTITDIGRKKFNEWVNSSIDLSSEKHPELLKIYFMGLSEKEGRGARIRQCIDEMQKKYEELKLIIDDGMNMQVDDEMRDVFYYQFMSAKYGLDIINFHINWYTELLGQIEGK